jgi:hypothetical protein
MQGIQFLTDHQGKKIAALVDLKVHRAFWLDVLQEVGEPTDFQFLVDEQGEKCAVLLDFSKHEELWEDIYDGLAIQSVKDEPRVSWEEVKHQLRVQDKLSV